MTPWDQTRREWEPIIVYVFDRGLIDTAESELFKRLSRFSWRIREAICKMALARESGS
jgi:hypothetical protein